MSLPKEGSAEINDVGGANATPGFGDGNPKEGSREIQDGRIVSEAMDWCKSPDAIVPYKIWAYQSQAANLANSVRQTDDRSHVLASLVLHCYGDEAGVGGGALSGTHNAECEPLTYSSTVRAEDRNMVRHDDLWWMNHKNTYGRLQYKKDINSYPTPRSPAITPDMQLASNDATVVSDAPQPGLGSAAPTTAATGTQVAAGAIALPAPTAGTGVWEGVKDLGKGLLGLGEEAGGATIAATVGLAAAILVATTTSTAKDDTIRVSGTGDCTPDQHRDLQDRVENACGTAQRCEKTDSLDILNAKIAAAYACIRARQNINNNCFKGGDKGHNTAIDQRMQSIKRCWEFGGAVR